MKIYASWGLIKAGCSCLLLSALLCSTSAQAELSCEGFHGLLDFIKKNHAETIPLREFSNHYVAGVNFAVDRLQRDDRLFNLEERKALTTPFGDNDLEFFSCRQAEKIAHAFAAQGRDEITHAMVWDWQLKGLLKSWDPHSDRLTQQEWELLQPALVNAARVGGKRAGKQGTLLAMQQSQAVAIAEQELFEGGVGYIKIADFLPNTYEEFREALLALLQEGARSLIIDLRNNPGGVMAEAIRILSIFIDAGVAVVYQDRDGVLTSLPFAEVDVNKEELPLVVLTNRLTASAAEFFAAAISDYERGILLGEPTNGKGNTQLFLPPEALRVYARNLAIDGALKLTTHWFFTASGDSPQQRRQRPHVAQQDRVLEQELRDKRQRLARSGEHLFVIESDYPNALPARTIPSQFSAATRPSNDMGRVVWHMDWVVREWQQLLPLSPHPDDDTYVAQAYMLLSYYQDRCLTYHQRQCDFPEEPMVYRELMFDPFNHLEWLTQRTANKS